MTTAEKGLIHEHLGAYRVAPAIDKLRAILPDDQTDSRQRLSTLEGRFEHLQNSRQYDYGPEDKRRQMEDLIKQLQLLLAAIPVDDRRKTLADILGRELDEEFKQRDNPTAALSAETPQEAASTKGFTGEIEYSGSATSKHAELSIAVPYGSAYHKCLQILRKVNATIEDSDRERGQIRAVRGGNSGDRYGTRILVWVHQMVRGRTKLEVVVDSQLSDTAFDFGRNQKLLDRITHALQYA